MSDVQTLLSTWADAERAADAATTERLLTDDFIGVGPVGFQLPKQAWVQRLAGGDVHYDHLHLDEVRIRPYGDAAIITARWDARGTAQGHPIPEATRVTVVAVNAEGGWQLATIHFSFIAGTPGAPGGPMPS